MNSELFTKNLQKLITEHGYTLQDVADKTGLTSSTISKYINGHMVPKNKNLLALAKVFSISVSELMGEEKQESPEEKLIKSIIDKTLDGKIKWIIKNDDTKEDLYNYYATAEIPERDIEIHYSVNIYAKNAYYFNLEIYNHITLFAQRIKRNKEVHIEKEKDKVENLLVNLTEIIYNRDLFIRQKEEQENLEMLTGIINSL